MPGPGRYHPVRLMSAEKEIRALELRKAGLSYLQIATMMGLSPTRVQGIIKKAFKKYMKERDELAEDVIRMEESRLDEMFMSLWQDTIRRADGTVPQISTGQRCKAIEQMLQIMQRRAKLRGLDAPEKQQIYQASIDLNQLSDDELKIEFEKLGMIEQISPPPAIDYVLPGEYIPEEKPD